MSYHTCRVCNGEGCDVCRAEQVNRMVERAYKDEERKRIEETERCVRSFVAYKGHGGILYEQLHPELIEMVTYAIEFGRRSQMRVEKEQVEPAEADPLDRFRQLDYR